MIRHHVMRLPQHRNTLQVHEPRRIVQRRPHQVKVRSVIARAHLPEQVAKAPTGPGVEEDVQLVADAGCFVNVHYGTSGRNLDFSSECCVVGDGVGPEEGGEEAEGVEFWDGAMVVLPWIWLC